MLRYRIALRNDKVTGGCETDDSSMQRLRSASSVRSPQNGIPAIVEASRPLRYYPLLFQDMTRRVPVLSAAAGLFCDVACSIQDNCYSTVDAPDERVKEQIYSIRR